MGEEVLPSWAPPKMAAKKSGLVPVAKRPAPSAPGKAVVPPALGKKLVSIGSAKLRPAPTPPKPAPEEDEDEIPPPPPPISLDDIPGPPPGEPPAAVETSRSPSPPAEAPAGDETPEAETAGAEEEEVIEQAKPPENVAAPSWAPLKAVGRQRADSNLEQFRKTVALDSGKVVSEDGDIIEDKSRTISLASVGNASGKVKVKGGQKKKWTEICLDVRDGMMYLYDDEGQLRKKTPFDTIALAGHQVADIPKVSHGFVVYKDSKKDGFLFSAPSSEDVKMWVNRVKEACQLGSTAIFGVPLPVVVRKSADKRVPDIMVVTFRALQTGGHLDAEGIFRLSGSASKVAALQEIFDAGSSTLPLQTDVHDITGVVKKFLRDLPEPLITFSLYDTFVNAFSNDDDAMALNLSRAVSQLPGPHRTTLAFLMLFLSDVATHEGKTKMGFHNLAVVFAPTILKLKGVDDFTNMDATLKVTEYLIRNAKAIFTEEVLTESGGKQGFTAATKDIVTGDEKKGVDMHLQQPTVGDANKLLVRLNVEVRDKKGKATGLEERIVVVGKWRVYLFLKGGRFSASHHILDLKEIFSPSPQDLRLTFNNGVISFKPMTNASAIDDVIHAIRFFYELSFPDAPTTSRFAVELKPPSRLRRINSEVTSCYGYANAFRGWCNQVGLAISPPVENVLTTINEVFSGNANKTFNLIECHPLDLLDRLPTPELGCLMGALHWNSWFTTLNVDNIQLKDGANSLFEVFAHNRTISSLQLRNCGIAANNLAHFAQALSKNPKPALQDIDLFNNSVEDKGAASLGAILETNKLKLRSLNLGSCRLSKKGVAALMQSLQKGQLTLKSLGLAETKIEHSIAAVIQFANAAGVTKLDLANSALSSSDLKPLTTCEDLDVSGNHIRPKELKSWAAFLGGSRHVTKANLANMALRPEQIPELDKLFLRASNLNLADNELGDQGIALLGRILSENSQLRQLNLDSCWGKRTASRDEAFLRFREVVTKCQLTSLSMRGGKFPLVEDACFIVLCVMFSTTIRSLDISDHKAGDSLAQVLSQVVQQNKNLETLIIDGNGFSYDAYRTFHLALQRNKTLLYLPFPYQDFQLLFARNPAEATALSRKIQNSMAEKAGVVKEQVVQDEDEVQDEDVPL